MSLFWKIPLVGIFAHITKTLTVVIKTIFKSPEKLKELQVMHQNGIYICIPWHMLICSKNMLISAEIKSCLTWYIYVLDLLYGNVKLWQVSSLWDVCDSKSPSWIGLNKIREYFFFIRKLVKMIFVIVLW